ncbi:MAG TPA: hypothetical protein VGL55_09265 [Steroidobacteraceae bacterium]
MHKIASMAAVGLFALALAACGGGDKLSASGSGTTGGTSGGTTGTGTGTGTGTTPTYSMGNGSGSSFQPGAIELSSTSLSAGGTTSLTVTVVDQTGTLYTGAQVTITFNSPCVAQGLASIAASGGTTAGNTAGTVVTSTGSASAIYTAKGCSGPDVITASAQVGAATLTATGTVTVAAAAVGSIQFVSAIPSTIGLKGTGLAETSTVIFKVVDSSGGPRPGVAVSFALNTNVGGISLSPSTATSANDGTVQTVVSAGTAHTSIRVTASIASPALTTQSGILAVTTGLPASNAFSIAVSCPNVEAAHIDGIVVPVTVRLADRYNNPAPDGTAIAFTTNGGHIVGNCATPSSPANPGDGTCSVNWTSADPRPTPQSTPPTLRTDRVTILATVIGEESFNDVNGNGYYDSGEPFSDLGEPYRDDNESNAYNLGEYFLDFNRDGVRNGPSGKFVGITCTGSTPGSKCTSSTLAIGATARIIMSDGVPVNVQPASNTSLGALAAGATGNYAFLFQDENNNPLPAGTTIAGAVVGTGLTINAPSTFTVPCTTNPTSYGFSVTASSSYAGGGSLTVTVTSPGGAGVGGVVTTLSYPFQ